MTDEPEADDELAKWGRRLKVDPRMREFPTLGWTVVLVPLDLFDSRNLARMFIGMSYDFDPEQVVSLRARRLAMDGEPERTWWVIAVRQSEIERRRRRVKKDQ